jgi:TolB-like protein/Flp pilus assembly protein TadD
MPLLFGDFLLDPDRRDLTQASKPVSVGPQVFDLLVYLIQNRERVVSKDDLIEAVWRGRIVSESTITTLINAARVAIGDNGQEQRFIRTAPRKGFRFVGEVNETDPARPNAPPPAPARPLALPDKPSVAVLPFVNLSGDAEQDYFADGVVEDIIAALARINWLFVIARNSSFVYKGRSINVKDVGRELGVRYVLEGSLRKAGDRVRIAGRLVDATTGGHLWADRYEGALDNIFDLQDQITEGIVGAISRQLENAEIERAARKPTESLDAYDHFLRGMCGFHAGGRDGVDDGLSYFRRAITLDRDYASAYAMAAFCLYSQGLNNWMADPALGIEEGISLARRAVALGKTDAVALARGGHALAQFTRDPDAGVDFLDSALALNPNFAAAWLSSGFLRVFRGEPDDAIKHFEHAMRLSPFDPELFRMQTGIAIAHLIAQRLDDAAAWAAKAVRNAPTLVLPGIVIAVSHVLSGRTEQAAHAMSHVRQHNDALNRARLERWLPFQRSQDADMFFKAMAKAGLSE